ncbi:hypothetical protein [Mycolicibacterium goodii]|uniref:hypothetical protein n=1 Tax=Mycolicibacterium goodii TaxID=134601 RepID=UPI001055D316|nr:hypothetical protein [Mycolicibacterium goodii]
MTELTELCDCPRRDHADSADGHCTLPSIRGGEPEDPHAGPQHAMRLLHGRLSRCARDADSGLRPRARPDGWSPPEYVAPPLPAEKRQSLPEQEARGELRIAPREQTGMIG